MEDGLTRAQHYRALAAQMREVAQQEPEIRRRNELIDLARQYDRLAEKLISALAVPPRETQA
jgi:hypothetical protein